MRGIGFAAVLTAVALALVPATTRAVADEPPDDDVFVNTSPDSVDGELIIRHADGTLSAAAGRARCPGCHWRLVPACSSNSVADDDLCAGAAAACPAEQLRYRVYLREAGAATYRPVAEICLGAGAVVVSTAALRTAVERYLQTLPLPEPGLAVQPTGPSVFGLPTVFYADDATTRTTEFGPSGVRVKVTASAASWRWDFGDGAQRVTDTPGHPWPHADVMHAYPAAGRYDASVTAVWTASYAVVGVTDELPVNGSVQRTSRRIVEVREAASELIGG